MQRLIVVLFCLLACACQKTESPAPSGKPEQASPASGPEYRDMPFRGSGTVG